MKGDFTRDTYHPEKHFNRVLMQQGRVQLDADWNEQTALTARRDETTTRDVVGHCGGPADDAAFGVLTVAPAGLPAPGPGDFYLSAGRYYVDGLQCELEAPVLFSKQPDRLNLGALPAGNHLLVLDVWSRHLTALDDDGMREHALGGPDTASRAKTISQVRAFALGGAPPTCAAEPAGFTALKDPGTARLTARTAAAAAPTDPCQVPENGGYTGLENQLYRVEIHEPSTAPGGASWKWSRENGSVVAAVEKIDPADAKRIFVSSVGADQETLGFKKDDIVELLDDANELESSPGQIAEVDAVDPDARVITLKTAIMRPAPAKPEGVDAAFHPKLRRWEGFAKVQANQFKLLEFSVQVRFDGGDYRNGHFWQIPARAATARSQRGEIEWPDDGAANPQPLSLTPRGITHHFCKLGVINVGAAPGLAVSVTSDCRCLWPALALVPRLFYVSGDGQEVMPDLTNATGQRYPLPQPLIVGLGNGHCAPAGTKVRFSVIVGDGRLNTGGPLASTIDVPIAPDGMAQCNFHLDGNYPAHYSQRVRAQLLNAAGAPCSLPIIFNATLSVASEVAYNPGTCAALQGRKNVQDAISSLAALVRLDKVGGDGQDTKPGQPVPNELIVLVGNKCGPVAGATVTFTAADGFVAKNAGDVTSSMSTTVDVLTNGSGIAQCFWRTAATPATQQLLAEITALPGGLAMEARRAVFFTANLHTEGHGGCCCVSVGKGGQFERLDLAVEQLMEEEKQTDICICLMPGDHRVPDDLVIRARGESEQPAFVSISGCGRATRLLLQKNKLRAVGLAAFKLSDLCIIAAENPRGTPIVIEECGELEITGCYLMQRQEVDPIDLLTVAHVARVVLADNRIESYWWQEPFIRLLGSDAGTRFEPGAFDALMVTAAEKLAKGGKPAQREFVKAFAPGTRARRTDDLRANAVAGILKEIEKVEIQGDKSEAIAAFRVLIPQLVIAPAVAFADAQADISILNNLILGEVRFYGTQSLLPAHTFDEIGRKVQGRTLTLVATEGTVNVEGNRLTTMVVDRKVGEVLTQVPPPKTLAVFNRVSLLNNTFFWPRPPDNEWLAADVIFNGNHFDLGRADTLGTVAATAFLCVGTSRKGVSMRYAVPTIPSGPPPAFEKAANLIQINPL